VKIPGIGCDWTFFRENTEGEHALGPNGATFDDMAFNFNIKE
jgi:isocitrate dehydrogenase (NAD+)